MALWVAWCPWIGTGRGQLYSYFLPPGQPFPTLAQQLPFCALHPLGLRCHRHSWLASWWGQFWSLILISMHSPKCSSEAIHWFLYIQKFSNKFSLEFSTYCSFYKGQSRLALFWHIPTHFEFSGWQSNGIKKIKTQKIISPDPYDRCTWMKVYWKKFLIGCPLNLHTYDAFFCMISARE